MKSSMRLDYLKVALTLMCSHGTSLHAYAQPNKPIFSLAKKEKPALLKTLEELVSIESGSGDIEGLDRIAELIAGRLKALGGKVEVRADPSEVTGWPTRPRRSERWCARRSPAPARRRSCCSRTWTPCTRAACSRSSRSGSTATARRASASRTTGRASRSSCTRSRSSRR